MDRRTFLSRTAILLGAAGTVGIATGCGKEGGGIPEGAAQLAPTIASFELLTGPSRPVPFGVRTLENVEVRDADIKVYLRDLEDASIVAGPFDTTYTEATGTGLGLYVVELELTDAKAVELVAVEGDRYGATPLPVVAPEDSKVVVPGAAAISTPTPTEGNELGYERICTQDPPCGMHEVSLDEALANGQPIMAIFATPEFCQTAVCGPAVGTIDQVRTGGEWGDAAWIHIEIYSKYSDAKQVLGEPVEAWKLPTEPWLFSIGADGKVAGRLDGPMLEGMITEMAEGITSA